ncbi:MAG: peptidylglycine alpha-amidating monooxygenase [Polyangiaceae bacterium]
MNPPTPSLPSFRPGLRTFAVVGALAATSCSSGELRIVADGGPGTTIADAGAGDGTVSVVPRSGELPCDVDAILGASCRKCHGPVPTFGAPMPLVTLADLTAPSSSDPSRPVHALVRSRIHDDARPMPQAPNPRLDATSLAALDAWIDSGAPAREGGTCAAVDAGRTNVTGELACTPDTSLRPKSPWTMPKDARDLYVCYGVDVEPGSKRHITALAPKIDNARILHHVVVLKVPQSADPTPQVCPYASALSGAMIYAWAPGGQALELPGEAGFPLEGTEHFLVQIHYNNVLALEGQTDSSGVDLCTTSTLRTYDADVAAFGSANFTIPARASLSLDCDYTIPEGLDGAHVFAAMPHMHQLGKSMRTVHRATGDASADVDLGHSDAWNFETQAWSAVGTTLRKGDVVSTRCVWDNPRETPVSFGEDTDEEMCFSFAMYYPKVTTRPWVWAAPSYRSRCTP